jgi:hypothetical protein
MKFVLKCLLYWHEKENNINANRVMRFLGRPGGKEYVNTSSKYALADEQNRHLLKKLHPHFCGALYFVMLPRLEGSSNAQLYRNSPSS